MKVFLDDMRSPPDMTWTLVRSYDEFVNLIQSNNLITHLSFDHDLGDEVHDGYNATKWFVELAMDNKEIALNLKIVIAHSDNTPGRENIAAYFESARAHGIFNDDLIVKRRPAMLNK